MLQNSVGDWLLALTIAVLGGIAASLVLRVATRLVGRVAARTQNRVDDVALAMLAATRRVFVVGAPVLAAAAILRLPDGARGFVTIASTLLIGMQIGLWLTAIVRHWSGELARRRVGVADTTNLSVLRVSLLVVVWIVLLLAVLDNLGVDVTALIAGLGIGGVALALAVQGIFADIVASIVIVLDKPFVIGDFVVVGDHMGTVEGIGLKTTRIRSLGGEELVFSHSDLLSSRIRNFKRMRERRVAFTLGVTYATPSERLASIPTLVRDIIAARDGARFERCHFATLADSALEFEVVFHVLDPDYGRYMDIRHAVNLALMESFARAGIEFAYPTRTLHLIAPRPEAA